MRAQVASEAESHLHLEAPFRVALPCDGGRADEVLEEALVSFCKVKKEDISIEVVKAERKIKKIKLKVD